MDYPEKVKQAFANKTDDLGVIAAADTEVPPVEHGDRWGNWEFDAERLVLVYSQEGRRERYEIDLESMTTSAEMLDFNLPDAYKDLDRPKRHRRSSASSRRSFSS